MSMCCFSYKVDIQIGRLAHSVKAPRSAALAGVPKPALEAGSLTKDSLALHRLDDVGLDARLCEGCPLSSLKLERDPVTLTNLLESGCAVRV